MNLTSAQMDRACGVLLASAAGDALGAGYEFRHDLADVVPAMIGGGLGNFAPGEWTDDTAQAVAIAVVAADGLDLRTPEALDRIAQGFADWYAAGPPDVGIQTSAVLSRAGRNPTGVEMAAAAAEVHARSGRSAGNGSLMRTGPVALAFLDDPSGLVEAAKAVSATDPLRGPGMGGVRRLVSDDPAHGRHRRVPDLRRHRTLGAEPRQVARHPRRGRSEGTQLLRPERLVGRRSAGGLVRDHAHTGARGRVHLPPPDGLADHGDPDRPRHRHGRRHRRRDARRAVGDERDPCRMASDPARLARCHRQGTGEARLPRRPQRRGGQVRLAAGRAHRLSARSSTARTRSPRTPSTTVSGSPARPCSTSCPKARTQWSASA